LNKEAKKREIFIVSDHMMMIVYLLFAVKFMLYGDALTRRGVVAIA